MTEPRVEAVGVVRSGCIYLERRPDRIFDILDVRYERSQRWASRFWLGVAIYRD